MNLKRAQKKYYDQKIEENRKKMWDFEFTKKFLLEVREGIRTEYDRVKENNDAAGRRLMKEKYEVFYAEDNSPVDILGLPLPVAEIEALPLEKTGDIRFYKKEKLEPDKTICDNLTNMMVKTGTDLKQLEEQMKGIDQRINGPLVDQQGQDQSINASMTNLMTVSKLLTDYIKEL